MSPAHVAIITRLKLGDWHGDGGVGRTHERPIRVARFGECRLVVEAGLPMNTTATFIGTHAGTGRITLRIRLLWGWREGAIVV